MNFTELARQVGNMAELASKSQLNLVSNPSHKCKNANLARVCGAPFGPLLLQVLLHYALDVLGRLVRHDPNGELAWNKN